MGICLDCFVEITSQDRGACGEPPRHWWVVATVAFNKDYTLNHRLHEHPEVRRLWPKDKSMEVGIQEKEHGIDQGRRWCDAATFSKALLMPREFAEDEPSAQAKALEAFLKVMVKEPWVKGLRLLFWES